MSTTDSDRIRQALGGLERCVGDSPDAGKYVFTTVKLPNNTDTTVKIQDISSLTKLTELRHLQLSGQAITDLSAIVGLPFLAELHVDHNELDMSIENCGARWCKEAAFGRRQEDLLVKSGAAASVLHRKVYNRLENHQS